MNKAYFIMYMHRKDDSVMLDTHVLHNVTLGPLKCKWGLYKKVH